MDFKALISVLLFPFLLLALAACERGEDPPPSMPAATDEGLSGGDEVSIMLRRAKELLAENRDADAKEIARRLRTLKDSLPPARRLEIARLEAMFVDEPWIQLPDSTNPLR